MKPSLLLLFFICFSFFVFAQSGAKSNSSSYSDLKYKLFEVDKGWGYDIMEKDNLLIHQPYIPGISGMQTFTSKTDAEKIANFAILKIKKGVFPPTVTKNELDSLKILMNH